MKRNYQLIIADDEPIECRALEHKLQAHSSNLILLPSVYDGVSLIKSVELYHPDLAIVDINMPGLNGLEAIELLKMKNLNLKIIINTSYSDFDYIQKALQLGACDYLLKPGSKELLIKAVSKACAQLEQEQENLSQLQEKQSVVDDLYLIAAEKWMLSLLLEQPDEKCYHLLLQNCPQIRLGGIFTAWNIHISEKTSLPDLTKPADFLTDFLQKFCICLQMQYKEILYLFFIPDAKTHTDEKQEFIHEIVEYGYQELLEHGYTACVGIGRYKREYAQLASGLLEARVALKEKNTPGIHLFHYNREKKNGITLKSLASACARLLKQKKTADCTELIKTNLEKEKNEILKNPEAFQIQAAAFIINLEQELMLAQMDLNRSWILWENYPDAADPRRTVEWLTKELERCCRALHTPPEQENIYVAKAILFMKEHYSSDISLEDVAQEIGISSFYLSRLFKQEKNLTFVEFLTDIRIRAAIQLLMDPNNSLKEICQQCGFSNLTYFYRVFKKKTGFTVGEMRQYL